MSICSIFFIWIFFFCPVFSLSFSLGCGKSRRTPCARTLHTLSKNGLQLVANSAPMDVTSPPDLESLPTGEISDPAYVDALSKVMYIDVPVPDTVSKAGTAGISYIHWPAHTRGQNSKEAFPLILIHGFDSSCLEFRRLGPKLAARGIDVYAVDLLGWGFTQMVGVDDFSAWSKVVTLQSFWRTINGVDEYGRVPNCVVGGASLGGAAAIEFANAYSAMPLDGDRVENPVKGMVLVDAQGFVDGVGPMASLPPLFAKFGIQVLKSKPLRGSANQMSYYRPDVFATDDALKIGRLHTLRDGWDDALQSFMLSGGFSPAKKVGGCTMPTLILWGRQDGILDGNEFVPKFLTELRNAKLSWVEECGHVPHLEQPEATSDAIAEFMTSENLRVRKERSNELNSKILIGAGAAAATLAGAAATFAAM